MQFHHHGYVSTDPRVLPAAGIGLNRPAELPDTMDVLIVGTGPAGMITAAQLSMFPSVHTRIVEKRPHRLEIGQADGIQARSVETFQAFGFADEIANEAYRITEMAFWKPDPDNPEHVHRAARTVDDPEKISEFPHLIVNQARVLDYFAQYMKRSPSRMEPDYGWEFLDLKVAENPEEHQYPVAVRLRRTDPHTGDTDEQAPVRTVYAKYVVGCDGARSKVRKAIGRTLSGDAANHAWGVMDVLADTDFPDIRMKCSIQSAHAGNILHIPREGHHLFRMYVDLGIVAEGDAGNVRQTPLEEIIRRANAILAPYTLDVKEVCWHSVYEVGHRLTDAFDDSEPHHPKERTPRVFITGDACHTHSAKAGQGMNVSLQDGFNIGWKLGHVLDGRGPARLLQTYSAERQEIAKNLIDFDKEWSTLMATPQEQLQDPSYLEDFYVKTAEFPAGFMTHYKPSQITTDSTGQELATGFPIGKRFHSFEVDRACDANPIHLGHEAMADGRWRIYVFADAAAANDQSSATYRFGQWLGQDPASPVVKYTPRDGDDDSYFDSKVIYQHDHTEINVPEVPAVFFPQVGPHRLHCYEKVFGAFSAPERDIFRARGISREGAVVVVRPDQYVAGVFSLKETDRLAAFFDGIFGRD